MTLARSAPSGTTIDTDRIANASLLPGLTLTEVLDGLDTSGRGVFHVDSYGATARDITTDPTTVTEAQRTANVVAIQTALDLALVHGGVVLLGPGVYHTNDRVGYFRDDDKNAPVIVQGQGGYSMIFSNNESACVLGFFTTGGNIRDLVVNDIMLHGGREGLLLYWTAYSRFNRIWFWGSKNFALQDQFGNNNFFHECRFDESAQGNANGVEADAVLMISAEETISCAGFGEFCGGIVMSNGFNVIQNCIFHDCKLRRGIFFDYVTNTTIDIDGGALLARPASVSLSGGYCEISDCTGDVVKRLVLAFRGNELVMSGGRYQAVAGFVGFIDVDPAGVGPIAVLDLALNVGDVTFQFNNNSGFLVQDLEDSLHDALLQAQVILGPSGTMTPFSTSAPSLLNPNFQNNLVTLRTFSNFNPAAIAAVTAWLRFTYGTVTGSGYSSVPDEIVSNPAVQSVDARRPVNGLSPDQLPTATFADGSSSSLSWPLNSGNNQTTKTGYACWVKQPASGGPERILSIGGGTGGASAQKMFLAFDSSQRVTVGVYSGASDGRQGTTGAAAFVADTWIFVRWAYDSSLGTEALRCKIYINGILQTLSFSDIGAGGSPTTLPVVTGNAIIGNFNNSGSSVQGLNGSIGANFYCIAGDLSAADEASLMAFQPPVAA